MRVGISGDSAGGNLAAAVTQQIKSSEFSFVMFSFNFNLIIVDIHLNYKYNVSIFFLLLI